jgi:hypothetical protein
MSSPTEDGIPGLCDSFPRGSPAEMQFFSNSDNVPEKPEIHACVH